MAEHLIGISPSPRRSLFQHLICVRPSSPAVEPGLAATDEMSPGSARRGTDHRIVPTKGSIVASFPAGRVCSDERCETRLSIYNSNEFCSVHTQPVKWVVKHPL